MLSHEELEKILQEQIEFLNSSIKSLDMGFEGEAKRLAVCTRVLVHDTPKSESLLKQLGMKTIPFYSTAYPWDPKNLLAHLGLLQIRWNNKGEASYIEPLDDRPPPFLRWVLFDEWWTEIVFDDRKGSSLMRKDIVLGLANKEGGAHVDPKLTIPYETITRHSIFLIIETPTGKKPLSGKMEILAMRQISHELLKTLERAGYSYVGISPSSN